MGENYITIKRKDKSKSTPQFRVAFFNPENTFIFWCTADISGCVTRLTLQIYDILNAKE